MFSDRTHAGKLLAEKLSRWRGKIDLILGLARGGVVISRELSRMFGIPHDALVVKKIGSPGNPEFATGAVVPHGQSIDVRNKSVLVVDDGVATGATMRAAIAWIKNHGAGTIVVAVPVAPPDAVARLRTLAADVIVLETPEDFGAVGEYYRDFAQLSDEEVVKLLA